MRFITLCTLLASSTIVAGRYMADLDSSSHGDSVARRAGYHPTFHTSEKNLKRREGKMMQRRQRPDRLNYKEKASSGGDGKGPRPSGNDDGARPSGGPDNNGDNSSWSSASATSSSQTTAATTQAAQQNNYVASSSSSQAQQTTSSSAVAAASTSSSTSSSSSSSSSTYTGEATFFYQGGNAGACGTVHSDSDLVVAIQSNLYGTSGSTSQYCGKTVVITNTDNSKSVTAIVADECPSCSSTYSLDLSQGAFDAIGEESTGVLSISWYFSN